MTIQNLFVKLQRATTVVEVDAALDEFIAAHQTEVSWAPVGARENNRGIIEVSSDPGRSLVERVTNSIDAVLEAEHDSHKGIPDCRTPKEAGTAWLNIPANGLSGMSPAQRQAIANRVVVQLLPGEGKESRVVEIRDTGTGLAPTEMPGTILSLNEGNKMQKHYVSGVYGQGGSSTFAASRYTLICSRKQGTSIVGFTVVKYVDLPADTYKIGNYAYLTLGEQVLQTELPEAEFLSGTQVKHFGYDLSDYSSPVGANSLYGLLNTVLFDPVIPVWLDNRIHDYRRVIKGSRNALNGAVDAGDDEKRGPKLAYDVKMFYVDLGEWGRIGIEYWLLERPDREDGSGNKIPITAFVNPSRSIILTLNGQNQAELSKTFIKNEADLPYLRQRLIAHIACDALTAPAKRALFVSNREAARGGVVLSRIQDEIVKALKTDDELKRLNEIARDNSLSQRDENAEKEMRNEVAKILRLQGFDITEATGGGITGNESPTARVRSGSSGGSRPEVKPLDLREPPTYIKIVWADDKPITFYSEQRRYVRIETDAGSNYHDPDNPANSRTNLVVVGQAAKLCGSTPLQGGRMRGIIEATTDAKTSDAGIIKVELSRPGLPILSDERA
ncbi:hypothetical protein AUJ14_01685, partial [Candidatus Micrarchaeota archaeon CG1_02_55_22]